MELTAAGPAVTRDAMTIVRAFMLSLRQLFDPAILGIVAKVVVVTLLLFAGAGVAFYFLLAWALGQLGVSVGDEMAALSSVVLITLGGWLLFRSIAIAVLGIFSDEIVTRVEARSYPDAAARAQPLGFARSLRMGAASAARAMGYNLLALPLYLVLLATGVGTIAAVVLVNALLLGRDLSDAVVARHPGLAMPGRGRRLGIGAIPAALFVIPGVNLLAPVIGAAMAVHLIHGRDQGNNHL